MASSHITTRRSSIRNARDAQEQEELICTKTRVLYVDSTLSINGEQGPGQHSAAQQGAAFVATRRNREEVQAFSARQPSDAIGTSIENLLRTYDSVHCFHSVAALGKWLRALGGRQSVPMCVFVRLSDEADEQLAELSHMRPRRCFVVGLTAGSDLSAELSYFAQGADEVISYPLLPSEVRRAACMMWRKLGYLMKPEIEMKGGKKNFERPDLCPTTAEWDALSQRMRTAHLQDKSSVTKMFQWHLPFDAVDSDRAGAYDKQYLDENRKRLQLAISTWNFSALHLPERDLVFYPLLMLRHILSTLDEAKYDLPDERIFAFLEVVKDTYFATNPYHNFRHAVDVMQAIFYFLISSGYLPPMHDGCPRFESIECKVLPKILNCKHMLAAMLVGIGHDCGHPGVNNALLVTIRSPLAQLYNDRSVLENLHSVTLCRILSHYWPAMQAPDMRKIIMELVLSTDMALHFDYMSKIKEMEQICLDTRAAGDPDVDIPPEVMDKYSLTLFAALTKCADISNVARPFDVSRDWANVLLREFFNQGRLEESLDLPVTKTFDPEQTKQADSQAFFINLFATPLFGSLTKVMPTLEPLTAQIEQNKQTWLNRKANASGVDLAPPLVAAAPPVAASASASASASMPEPVSNDAAINGTNGHASLLAHDSSTAPSATESASAGSPAGTTMTTMAPADAGLIGGGGVAGGVGAGAGIAEAKSVQPAVSAALSTDADRPTTEGSDGSVATGGPASPQGQGQGPSPGQGRAHSVTKKKSSVFSFLKRKKQAHATASPAPAAAATTSNDAVAGA